MRPSAPEPERRQASIDGQSPTVFLWSVAINLAAWVFLIALVEGRLF